MNKEMNVLNMLYAVFTDVPVHFRQRVCEECNYSIPTFYRKVRGVNKVENKEVVHLLSNAEKAKIREIVEEVRLELENLISNFIGLK